MIFIFFYNVIFGIFLLCSTPIFAYQYLRYNKYRASLKQRVGGGFPRIAKGNKKLVWIHAVSVGETKAIAALAKKMKEEPNAPIILISSITETGHAEALRSLPFADYHVYLPFDFSFIMYPIIQQAKPDLLLISETDLWFNFLKSAKRCGARIALVNGKVSERSMKRLKLFSFFSARLFSLFDQLIVQDETYYDRFLKLGVSKEKISISGNLKFDDEYIKMDTNEKEALRQKIGVALNQPVVVIGSTHDPEEKMMITELQSVWKKIPDLKVILVPRHPERFDAVAHLLTTQHIPFSRWSTGPQEDSNVVLVDAMGILRQCYQIADVAVVGGSFTSKVGGHNIVEPCMYGIPVVFGLHMYSQPEMVRLVLEDHAGCQIPLSDFSETILKLLLNADEKMRLSQGSFKLASHVKGALQRTYVHLKTWL